MKLEQPRSIRRAEVIGKVLGKHIRYKPVFPFLAGIWLRRSGRFRQLVKAPLETLRALRKNEHAYVTEDVERVTGHKPRAFEALPRECCRFSMTGKIRLPKRCT